MSFVPGMRLGNANQEVFSEALLTLARADRQVLAVTSDSRGSGKLMPYAAAVPDQLIEVGIAEQNLVGVAAGLTSAGKTVFAVSPASFLTARALEQIKNDVAYSDNPVNVIGISAGNHWHYLATGYGAWYLVELLGFIALPAFLYAVGVRDKNVTLIRWTAAWTVLGIVVNRFNICLVAFNWHLPAADRYFPHLLEIVTSVFIVTIGVIAYRFIVNNMPVLYEHPDYKDTH